MAFLAPEEELQSAAAAVDPAQGFTAPEGETDGGFVAPEQDRKTAIPDLVADDNFDPLSYALETGDTETAKEVAWQKRSKPMTASRFGGLVKKFGGAAVDLVKDFGGGLGDVGIDTWFIAHPPDSDFWKGQGIDPETAKTIIEKAKTQQLLRAQLIEEHSGSLLGKVFGKEGVIGGPVGRRGAQAVLGLAKYLPGIDNDEMDNAIVAIQDDVEDREKNPRPYFDAKFDEAISHAKKASAIETGHIQDDGVIAGGLKALDYGTQRLAGSAPEDIKPYLPSEEFMGGDELAALGAPVDEDSIRRGSVVADPINLLPLHIPGAGKLISPLAGVALRTPIKIAEEVAARTPTLAKLGKYGLGGGAAAYIGHEVFTDPGKAAEHAVEALGVYAGVKGVKLLGHVVDNAGAKLMNPRFVSAAERAAAEETLQTGKRGFFSGKQNLADAERTASKVVQGAVSAPAVMAPLNYAISDTPEEFAQLEGGVAGFGGLAGVTGYNPVRGFRPETIQAVDAVLRDQGAAKEYGTPLDAQHAAYMEKAPQWVKDGVNAYRGFFDGFKLPGGKEPEIYVLPADQFAAEAVRNDPSLTPELAAKQRGFKSGEGKVVINGDYGAGGGKEAPSVLGHEAGGHVAQTIMDLLSPDVAASMRDAATRNLLTNTGRPTAKLRKFVKAYNQAFDPTGARVEIKDTDHAINEWLAEQGRAVLEGTGPAKFAAGQSLRETMLDNLGDYFRRTLGTKHKFSREEVPVIAREYRNMLFELGRLRGNHPDPDVAAAQQASRNAPAPAPAPAPGPAQPGSAAAANPTGPAPAPAGAMPAPAGGTARPAPAGAPGDAFADVGTSQGVIRQARADYVRENGQEPKPVRANTKKNIPGKTADEIMAEREAEFDAALGELTKYARENGYHLPNNIRELHQVIREYTVDPDAFFARFDRAPAPKPAADAPAAPRVDRIEPQREGDPEPGDFAIQDAERDALTARGWTDAEIALMPLHQVEAEVAAHERGEPAPQASPAPSPAPLATPAGVGQPPGPAAVATGPLGSFSVPTGEGAVAAPVAARPLATFDPNAEPAPTPTSQVSTGATPDAPQQRADSVPAAGAGEVPAVSAQAITEALARADTAAEARAAKVRGGKKNSAEKIKADIAREERVNALAGLLDPNAPGLRPVTDPATGEIHFEGAVDPANPVHAAILKEYGYKPQHVANIDRLQKGTGKGVVLRDYNAAEQEGHETGEGLDLSGQKRGAEYQASPTGEVGQRQGKVTKQDKGFTPWKTILTNKGVLLRGFDHDKFLHNMRTILDAAGEQGLETGLDGKSNPERDAAVADAFRKVAENHANGWKGDGSEPLKTFPDTGIKQNLDYIGQEVDPRLADVINMAMNIRSARPPKPPRAAKGKEATDLAQKKFAAASAEAKEAQGLAQLNEGFLNPETGETNALREAMETNGFETGKQLKPTVSNIRPDLIEGGIHDTPTHGKNVHAHGFDIPAPDLTVSGSPHGKPTAAGFMPGDGEPEGQLSKFGVSRIKNVRAAAIQLKDGTVVESASHAFARDRAEQDGQDTHAAVDGFTLPDGTFIDRNEATKRFGGSVTEDFRVKPKPKNEISDEDLLAALREPDGGKQLSNFMPGGDEPSIKSKVTDGDYPRVQPGRQVSGLTVRAEIPNRSSIRSSFDNPNILPGIREIPMSELRDPDGKGYASKDDADRVDRLAAEIKESGEIAPLIVGIDETGPYVVEGSHRLEALAKNGVESVPALVVKEKVAYGVSKKGEDYIVHLQGSDKPISKHGTPEEAWDAAETLEEGVQFMPGESEGVQRGLDDLAEKHKGNLRSRAYIMEAGGKAVIKLDDLAAKKDAPKGTGTAFMEDLTAFADKEGLPIVLQTATKGDLKDPVYKGTSSTTRLQKFYSRFGFRSNYSKRSYRPDLPGNMNRPPQDFMPGEGDVQFAQPERAKRAGDVVVNVNIAAFDKAFAKDNGFYVGPGGEGGIKGRREGFQDFMTRGSFDPRTQSYTKKPIEMPEVSITPQGAAAFVNGRHRYSVLRDAGRETMPISMDAESAARAKELGLTADDAEAPKGDLANFSPDAPAPAKEGGPLASFMPGELSGRGEFEVKKTEPAPDEKKARLRADLSEQSKWLTAQARDLGFDSPDALAENDLGKFMELGKQWRADHPRFDKEGNQLFMPGDDKPLTPQKRDKNFKKWAGKGAQIAEHPLGEDFDPNKPLVVRVDHGSTHDFNEVNADLGNPENHFGKGFYGTDSTIDAGQNYAGEGPDLTSRIEKRAENLDNEIQGMEADEIVDRYGVTPEQAKLLIDDEGFSYGSPKAEEKNAILKDLARKELHGGSPSTYRVWMKMNKPLILEKDGGTRFDALEKYDEETDEYSENPDSLPMKLYDSIQENAPQYRVDAQEVWNELNEAIGGDWDGVTAYDVDAALRKLNAVMDAQDAEGNLATNDFIKEAFRGMGFDGIVMDADEAFGNRRKGGKAMQMDYGTRHYIVFDPHQVKSATGNAGTFDPANPDMRFMPGDAPKRTWFLRDGKRVYHKRHPGSGQFVPKQTLAIPYPHALPSDKDKKPLAEFAAP